MPESKVEAAAPAVMDAVRELTEVGGHLLTSAKLSALAEADRSDWARFGAHWNELTLDTYMRDGGTYRYRRYGHFDYDADTETLTTLPHAPYSQTSAINPLNGGIQRHFDPLTDGFLTDPLLAGIVRVLGRVFSAVEGVARWDVKLHPFRIVTSPGELGKPAPQGRHRDGSTFVTSLLIGRTNITGGESSAYDEQGRQLFATQLTEPGDQLLVDDRRLLHDVTPIVPVIAAEPAYRDVLIVDFDLP